MKTGLVLEGGAMRGMFSAGIIDIFMEEGVEFDGCIGTSAGAIAGCNIKSRQPGRILRYMSKYCNNPGYCSIRSLIFTGNLYNVDFGYNLIPNKLDPFDTEAFKDHPMDFYVNTTDVITGKPIYHKCETGDEADITWMRASASMPLVSRVVEIDGYKMLDGGIADSIPLKFMESIGYKKNVVILTQPESFRKKPSGKDKVIRFLLGKYPNLAKTLYNRHRSYNKVLEYVKEREASGSVLRLLPDEDLKIGKVEHDAGELKRVYDIGRKMGYKRLSEVKEFLKS